MRSVMSKSAMNTNPFAPSPDIQDVLPAPTVGRTTWAISVVVIASIFALVEVETLPFRRIFQQSILGSIFLLFTPPTLWVFLCRVAPLQRTRLAMFIDALSYYVAYLIPFLISLEALEHLAGCQSRRSGFSLNHAMAGVLSVAIGCGVIVMRDTMGRQNHGMNTERPIVFFGS